MSPAGLVDYQKTCDKQDEYKVLDLIQDWITEKTGLRHKTKIVYMSTVISLFSHNRAQLPSDPSFRIKSEKQPVIGVLTVEELKNMCLSSSPMYRAIYVSMFMGGLGTAELLYWSNNGLENLLDKLHRGELHIKIELPGRKKTEKRDSLLHLAGL